LEKETTAGQTLSKLDELKEKLGKVYSLDPLKDILAELSPENNNRKEVSRKVQEFALSEARKHQSGELSVIMQRTKNAI
jgi:hypothetical protein